MAYLSGWVIVASLIVFINHSKVLCQSYEDARCKCVCTVINGTQVYRKLYITNVPADKDCDSVILPQTAVVAAQVKGNDSEPPQPLQCPLCHCNYQSRNTTTIKVVVIFVSAVIALLLIYMAYLMMVEPATGVNAKRGVRRGYQEHTNEEDEFGSNGGISGNGIEMASENGEPSVGNNTVLNRVGAQQDRWKKQVRQQREIIYDRHDMLN